jgi:hypothetical protein
MKIVSATVSCSIEFRTIFNGAHVPVQVINPDMRRTLAELDADVCQRRVEVAFDLETGSCVCKLNQNKTIPVFEQGHVWQAYAVRPSTADALPSFAYDVQRTMLLMCPL